MIDKRMNTVAAAVQMARMAAEQSRIRRNEVKTVFTIPVQVSITTRLTRSPQKSSNPSSFNQNQINYTTSPVLTHQLMSNLNINSVYPQVYQRDIPFLPIAVRVQSTKKGRAFEAANNNASSRERKNSQPVKKINGDRDEHISINPNELLQYSQPDKHGSIYERPPSFGRLPYQINTGEALNRQNLSKSHYATLQSANHNQTLSQLNQSRRNNELPHSFQTANHSYVFQTPPNQNHSTNQSVGATSSYNGVSLTGDTNRSYTSIQNKRSLLADKFNSHRKNGKQIMIPLLTSPQNSKNNVNRSKSPKIRIIDDLSRPKKVRPAQVLKKVDRTKPELGYYDTNVSSRSGKIQLNMTAERIFTQSKTMLNSPSLRTPSRQGNIGQLPRKTHMLDTTATSVKRRRESSRSQSIQRRFPSRSLSPAETKDLLVRLHTPRKNYGSSCESCSPQRRRTLLLSYENFSALVNSSSYLRNSLDLDNMVICFNEVKKNAVPYSIIVNYLHDKVASSELYVKRL